MRKFKGFTLIETVISMFILMLVITIYTSLSNIKFNLEKQIEYDMDVYEIQNFLTLSKAICKKENVNGSIIINSKDGEMYFYYNEFNASQFRKLKLSENSKIIENNTTLYLENNGKIKSATTISIKNNENMTQITIGVGVDTIKINE